MPCLLAILALSFPRLVLLILFFFTHYLDRAYSGFLVPLLGFLFLPLTTIAYAWAINSRGSVDGIHLVGVVLAVLIDLGLLGWGGSKRRESR